jgi:hypothetical protein
LRADQARREPGGPIISGAGSKIMPSKDYFRNLARMSRRIAGNMTDRAIAARLEAIGAEFDLQADATPDCDPADHLAPPPPRNQVHDERT